jgi:hypothetical protein
MKRTRMSTLLALAAASMSTELNILAAAHTKKQDDETGAKNGLNCVSNGMAYTGGGSGISINRGDHTGQGKKSIAALKTAKDLGHAAVPTSLLAAAAKNSTACRAGARC